MDGFIGEIRAFCFNYVPQGWLACNGQELPINQYTALFSIINNKYGGDGVTTFKLPNLQGYAAIGAGPNTPETSERIIGQKVGTPGITLSNNQLPAHNHNVKVISIQARDLDPTGAYLATGYGAGTRPAPTMTYAPQSNTVMASQMVQQAGSAVVASHENRQPYQVTTMCICQDGVYPVKP